MILTRFHDIEKIELDIEFLTPTFLGGADQNAELRSAPFKAALRYWWRVLYGAKYNDDLLTAESQRFGSTDGSSKVRIDISGTVKAKTSDFPEADKVPVTSKGKTFPINILDYLAYGHYDYSRESHKNVYKHSHIIVGEKCCMHLYISKNNDVLPEIIGSVKAFCSYGSVGARSRNGFGSIHSEKAEKLCWQYGEKIGEPMDYPAISKKSALFISGQVFDTPIKALSHGGKLYKAARNALEARHVFNRRGLISRPIEVKNETIPLDIKSGRHPKPFYLGVKRDNGKYRSLILSLPIRFYEPPKIEQYYQAVNDMHTALSAAGLINKSSEILSRLELN